MPRRRDGNALDASVLEDIDTILNAFEADPLRSLASFRHLAERFRVSDLHLTPRAGGREPGVDETPDSYAMLLAARIVTSLNHGAFFGVGSVVAAGLVPPERRAGAIATMFMGLTIATIGGVPLATWAGEAFGWRAVFAAIAAIGVVTMAALRLFVPALPGQADADMGAELRVLGRGAFVHVAAARLQLLERERDEELGRGELVLEHVVERRVRLELRVLLAQPVHVLAV